jgi:predicted lactoylglutathione lyase
MADHDHTEKVENTIPVLGVKNLQASKKFYTEKLGFKLDWEGDVVCSVSKGGHPIMLSQIDAQNCRSWVWIGLEDDTLFQTYKDNGVKVYQEPKNCTWAYEMKFEDIDGNILWLGTETKKNLPLDE